jgi:hypothetical protein
VGACLHGCGLLILSSPSSARNGPVSQPINDRLRGRVRPLSGLGVNHYSLLLGVACVTL